MASTKVLIVDDHIGDITWLVDFLEDRGYTTDHDTNEMAARRRLEQIRNGDLEYAHAIVDIMVSIDDITELMELDEKFYRDSRDTGLRLCQYARKELKISKTVLPIVCLSAAADREEIRSGLKELNIELYSRAPQSKDEDIREYLIENLAVV